jgi:MFS transporter, ACS family, DAL5 transporter family protein
VAGEQHDGALQACFVTSLQIGFGNIAGIIGSNSFLTTEAPHYPTGYGTGLALILFCILVCAIFQHGLNRGNGKRDRGERDYRVTLTDAENLGHDHLEFRYII